MNKARRKSLEAAVSHGFRKNDFNSLANALLVNGITYQCRKLFKSK